MNRLKNYCYVAMMLCCAMFTACTDKTNEELPMPTTQDAKIEEVEGLEKGYSVRLGSDLTLEPHIIFGDGKPQELTYEWTMDYKVVSKNAKLMVTCTELGKHNIALKVMAKDGTARFAETTVYVYSDFDRGLLLLTDVDGEAQLAYKALDMMEAAAVRNVFAECNEGKRLGKGPLALCWTGEGITNHNNVEDISTGGLEIVVSTAEENKVAILDSRTLKLKDIIAYDGENGNFTPNFAFVPYGVQNFLWSQDGGDIYFVGNGNDYMLSSTRHFVTGKRRHQLPAGAKVADMACSLITNPMDMVRVYFDMAKHHLIYIGGIKGMVEGKVTCDVVPMALMACDGKRADFNAAFRYEPEHVMLVGREANGSVKIWRLAPAANKANETLISEIDATGFITANAAMTVNPLRPLLYYTNSEGKVFVMNYEGTKFNTAPYIALGKDYDIKAMIFNPYNPNELYVAANNTKANKNRCATIFVIDVKDKSEGKLLYKEEGVGGMVKRLVYKGNGTENSVENM